MPATACIATPVSSRRTCSCIRYIPRRQVVVQVLFRGRLTMYTLDRLCYVVRTVLYFAVEVKVDRPHIGLLRSLFVAK